MITGAHSARSARCLLVIGGLVLVLGDLGFFLWWRDWAWGNRAMVDPFRRPVAGDPASAVAASRRGVLEEARERFSYGGRPIHPGIVARFCPLLHDGDSPVLAMDVSLAMGQAEFEEPVVQSAPGFFEAVTRREEDPDEPFPERLWDHFGYRLAGRLGDGTLVLDVVDWSGGGTGRFMYLLFVRFEVTSVGGRDALVMRYVDVLPLGDRFLGEIRVLGGHVEIEEQRHNEFTGGVAPTNYVPRLESWRRVVR